VRVKDDYADLYMSKGNRFYFLPVIVCRWEGLFVFSEPKNTLANEETSSVLLTISVQINLVEVITNCQRCNEFGIKASYYILCF